MSLFSKQTDLYVAIRVYLNMHMLEKIYIYILSLSFLVSYNKTILLFILWISASLRDSCISNTCSCFLTWSVQM